MGRSLNGHNDQQANWQAKVLYQAGQRKKDKMSRKSKLAEQGMKLAQVGQAFVHAVVDNGGTDDDAVKILSDLMLAKNLALLTLGRGELVLKKAEPEPVVSYCRLLSKGKKVIIGATNGKATIAKAKDAFHGWIDADYVNYGTNVPGSPTKKTRVEVLELIRGGTFEQIYDSFGGNRECLCLTQSQIIRFVKSHVKWLSADGITFFLFKEKVNIKDEFFVAYVRWYEGRLEACVYRLSFDNVWDAERRHRVVVPQSLCL